MTFNVILTSERKIRDGQKNRMLYYGNIACQEERKRLELQFAIVLQTEPRQGRSTLFLWCGYRSRRSRCQEEQGVDINRRNVTAQYSHFSSRYRNIYKTDRAGRCRQIKHLRSLNLAGVSWVQRWRCWRDRRDLVTISLVSIILL